jgi:hypothetical protein
MFWHFLIFGCVLLTAAFPAGWRAAAEVSRNFSRVPFIEESLLDLINREHNIYNQKWGIHNFGGRTSEVHSSLHQKFFSRATYRKEVLLLPSKKLVKSIPIFLLHSYYSPLVCEGRRRSQLEVVISPHKFTIPTHKEESRSGVITSEA